MTRPSTRIWATGTLALLAGLAVGRLLPGAEAPTSGPAAGEAERERIGVSRLTSPFLECVGRRDLDLGLVAARGRIEDYLRQRKAQDPTLEVSVYARDLLDGPWIGIDERRPFQPASLMKVAVLFHALARMDAEPTLRTRTITYGGPGAMQSADNLADRPATERMREGETYTFEQLLERMIVYSDNHARELVMAGVEPHEVDDFMESVGVPKVVDGGQAVMNARAYGGLFRILYNSTVFSRPASEFALDLLSRARYADGLRAGVPDDVVVASKFGVHRAPGDGTQVHECGIVYAEGRPYVVCVMTRSDRQSAQELGSLVARVGALVYEARTAD